MAPRFRLQAPRVPEHPLQKQIADVLRVEIAPPGKVSKHGVVWWSIDHANYAGEVPGIRVGRGIIAGIPDLFLAWRGLAHLIEIKTDDGEVTDTQQAVITAAAVSGMRVGVARDAIEVLICIDQWGIPRARRVREAA
jgi:VRR-NUC domain